jgi:hypothetical protein
VSRGYHTCCYGVCRSLIKIKVPILRALTRHDDDDAGDVEQEVSREAYSISLSTLVFVIIGMSKKDRQLFLCPGGQINNCLYYRPIGVHAEALYL